MKKENCPICGGKIEVKQGERLGLCDSCGNSFSLSELSKLKNQKYIRQAPSSPPHDKDGEYESAFDIEDCVELTYEQLYEKTELALETEEWNIANSYCDEILRRDPKNAYAYLYKLLTELRLYKKEDLAYCGTDFSESENYRLFTRFADDFIGSEIISYLECNNKQMEEKRIEEMYNTACALFKKADYANALYYFSTLEGYKDSNTLSENCRYSIQKSKEEQETKKSRKKVIVYSIISSIIAIILLTIVIGVVSKKNKYDVTKIDIDIASVEKEYRENDSPYLDGCYYIHLNYEIKNGTTTAIDYIEIVSYYVDSTGKSIGHITSSFGGSYSSSISLTAGTTQIHETYISENQPKGNQFFTELYNKDFSEFTITHKVISVEFSDGNYYSAD